MNSKQKDRRTDRDRRISPTPFASRYAFTGGRRKIVRRTGDRRKHLFVDLYDTRLFIVLFILLVLNVLDGFLTIILIRENIVVEANPVMAFYLDYGHMSFFAMKSIFFSAALLIFCIFRGFMITNVLLACSAIVYISVLLYELYVVYEEYPRLFLH